MEIKFRCDKQTLRRTDNERVASDSVNFLRAVFTFDSEWDSFSKSAIFSRFGQSYQVLLDSDGGCTVASEVLEGAGWFEVGVVGVKSNGTVRATANRVCVAVEESGPVTGDNSAMPTPDIVEQLTAKINTILAATVDNTDLRGYGIVPAQRIQDFEDLVFETLFQRYFLWLGNTTAYAAHNGSVNLSYGNIYSVSRADGGTFNVTYVGTLKGDRGIQGPAGTDGTNGIMYATDTDDIDALPTNERCHFLWMGEDKTQYGRTVLRFGTVYQISGTLIDRYCMPCCFLCGGAPSYEKIVDYTVTQADVSAGKTSFTFEEDLDGDGFSLEAITAYIDAPPASEAGALELRLNSGGYKSAYKRLNMITTGNSSIKMDLFLRGYWTGTSVLAGGRNDNSSYNEYGIIAKNGLTLPAIGISVASSIVIPAGTHIEIFGVRTLYYV